MTGKRKKKKREKVQLKEKQREIKLHYKTMGAAPKKSINPCQTLSNISGLCFKLYIILSLGIHDASSLSHSECGGGSSSFHLSAIHLLAVINAILINLTVFLLHCSGSKDLSPNSTSLGSCGIVIPVITDTFLNISSQ